MAEEKQMKRPIYLDYMATTPTDPRVIAPMVSCCIAEGNFGNSSSRSHSYGWSAHKAIEAARQQVADLINSEASEIIFTSGATESNNLAIKGAVDFYQRKGRHLITVKSEHKSVLGPCQALGRQGYEITYLTVGNDGLIDLAELAATIRDD